MMVCCYNVFLYPPFVLVSEYIGMADRSFLFVTGFSSFCSIKFDKVSILWFLVYFLEEAVEIFAELGIAHSVLTGLLVLSSQESVIFRRLLSILSRCCSKGTEKRQKKNEVKRKKCYVGK